jgi:hypothetical protein
LKSFTTHNHVPISGLDAAALSVNLGAVWRFIADASFGATSPFDGGSGTASWKPAGGTGDQVNVELEVIPFGTAPGTDFLNAYYSRLGNIIRPVVNLPGCATALKFNNLAGHYVGGSPLSTTSIEAFTVSLVADIDTSPWAFTDLISTFTSAPVSTVGDPTKATNCCLRLHEDRVIVYARGRRAFDELINSVAAAQNAPLNVETRRPTIIVLAMDAAGSGSLVITTPKVHRHAELNFAAGANWSLQAPDHAFGLGGTAAGGEAEGLGGMTIGFSNFQLPAIGGVYDPTYVGGAATWSLYDAGFWDTALDLADCITVANKLDNVYGVAR